MGAFGFLYAAEVIGVRNTLIILGVINLFIGNVVYFLST